jgi:hypothetical protein
MGVGVTRLRRSDHSIVDVAVVAEVLEGTTVVVSREVEAGEAEVVVAVAVASRVGVPTATQCVAILGGIAHDSLSLPLVVMRSTNSGFCSLGLSVR